MLLILFYEPRLSPSERDLRYKKAIGEMTKITVKDTPPSHEINSGWWALIYITWFESGIIYQFKKNCAGSFKNSSVLIAITFFLLDYILNDRPKKVQTRVSPQSCCFAYFLITPWQQTKGSHFVLGRTFYYFCGKVTHCYRLLPTVIDYFLLL